MLRHVSAAIAVVCLTFVSVAAVGAAAPPNNFGAGQQLSMLWSVGTTDGFISGNASAGTGRGSIGGPPAPLDHVAADYIVATCIDKSLMPLTCTFEEWNVQAENPTASVQKDLGSAYGSGFGPGSHCVSFFPLVGDPTGYCEDVSGILTISGSANGPVIVFAGGEVGYIVPGVVVNVGVSVSRLRPAAATGSFGSLTFAPPTYAFILSGMSISPTICPHFSPCL